VKKPIDILAVPKQPRFIHFYLWWWRGKPIYVGQAIDVEERNSARLRGVGKDAIGLFIAAHPR